MIQGKAWENHHTKVLWGGREGRQDSSNMSKYLLEESLNNMCWTWGVHMATVRHPKTSYTKTTEKIEGRKGTQDYSTFPELETLPNLPNTLLRG